MAVVIRLQGLPIVAGTMDIRHFFSGLTIPDGGVHIVGGEHGEAFIVFATDEDARLGMMRTGGTIKGSKVTLLLSSKTEMQNMIELSRRRFETANLDMSPANSGRAGAAPNSGLSGRGTLPTTLPSTLSSAMPTALPSSLSSSMPSSIPSSLPSALPSAVPSALSSSVPSAVPNAMPSAIPSAMPSTASSALPSGMPSALPSCMPSVLPSGMPGTLPSGMPGTLPSGMPGALPSGMPGSLSSMPGSLPSGMPGSLPSSVPGALTTGVPGSLPSGLSGSLPSGLPGTMPSSMPGALPSGVSSGTPSGMSGMPSGMPSGMSGGMPSCMSGGMPSGMPSGMSGGMPSGMSGGMPSGMSGGMPSGMSGGMPSGMSGGMPSGMSGGMPSGMSGGMPSGMSGGMPSGMSGGMPSGMSGGMPSGMTAGMPSGLSSSMPSGMLPSGMPSTLSSGMSTSVPASMPTTMPSFSSSAPSVTSTPSTAHESNKNLPSFSTSTMGSVPPSVGTTFVTPSFSTTIQSSAVAQMNSLPPPPVPPLPSMSSLPPLPSLPPISVPPPVPTMPPVPPVPPLTSLPPMAGMPPMNTPPVGPVPGGMSSSRPVMNLNNSMNPLFMGPMNPANPVNPLSSQSTLKPHPINPDDLYIRLHGVPFSATEADVRDYYSGLQVESVYMLRDHLGRSSGIVFVKFFSPQDTFEALTRPRQPMGGRFIDVSPATEGQWIASGAPLSFKQSIGYSAQSRLHSQSRSGSPGGRRRSRSRSPHEQDFCVYLRGLPYETGKDQVREFFKKLDIVEDTIYIVQGPDGRASGEGFVEFKTEIDYKAALCRNRQHLGNRFVQVHPISKRGMLEKIGAIRSRLHSQGYSDQNPNVKFEGEKAQPRICAHISNLPYNVTSKQILQFLEGIGVEENSLRVLVDNNGHGLGQAVVKFKSEEEALKAEQLHRKKLNGRDAFLNLCTVEDMKALERNPPLHIGRRGVKYPLLVSSSSSSGQNYSREDEYSQTSNTSSENQNSHPFTSAKAFSSSSNMFGPPLPPPGLGTSFSEGHSGAAPNGSSGLPGPAGEPPSYGSSSSSLSGPSSYGAAPGNLSAPPSFGNGPGKLSAPPGFGSAPPSFGSGPPAPGSGPSQLSAPPGFGPAPSTLTGPPGFTAGPGKTAPAVVKVQNMPFTVTVDEIMDFFYGYQLIPGSVCLKFSEKGLPTGEAMVAFESRDEATAAVVDLNDRPIGSRKVKLVLG
ncbi:RNA-binding protein 12-like isoform X1 [Protopterus annectens]|uniref:RNA-binding protein 12-like isoform X1 n=1 Tax=Protopterus annectens TaxID=7888 RepID=UPI001CFBD277|nr:RNA-binding protein 12-like isoform X1 [Protopterus annectens]XP_043946078.1 RNA-binding protein 12-like isoform X1 [Protopterus annectens]XP_043946079.1 RNA-binding protein 12-like isoform X1 [Protopterus annectens]XP_043946080.1 RNA-binding protein 12-like isoform X1 [Protopterus annectens]XP_043946081.1 RNA-binding protein 12-like isoform X1 [Protopterus annectens]XP_043946082.1 RNA-binding protein 12-like isoform X1 [Protopterus annectens]XP_043946083.1 RNA-binding protein 12-like isof